MRMKHFRGFGLIEVLVSLLLICVGLLGMVALQGRSVQQAQSAVSHSQAVMLADQLLELMRSNPDGALTNSLFTTASSYYKAPGASFATSSTSSNCLSRSRSAGGSSVASADLGCWAQQVSKLLPVSDALLSADFAVCPSRTPDSCDTTSSSVVMIQVAWTDNSGQCDDAVCYYRLRSEL